MDEGFTYHGIVRGNRPDGIGIIMQNSNVFTIRGCFCNTKLNGPGRIELENGVIFDGIFRNGIFCKGVCYFSKENRYFD